MARRPWRRPGGLFTDATDVGGVGWQLTEGIPSEISFRVRMTLDPTANNADVQRLIDAGLDELWSDTFTVSPYTPIGGCNGYYWTPPWRDSSRW